MKRMLFNATQAEELRVAIVDGQKLIDLDIESAAKEQRKSNIYKAVITRIEPSLEAAFVDYGAERHGFLPFKEVSRAYFKEGVEVRSARIQDALQVGQELIVQVEKDERGNKGAALTTYISLAGRYLVLMPNNPRGGGVSRRVEGDERIELREAMDQLEVPGGMSMIARTAAINRKAEELQWDLNYLLQLWRAIEGAAQAQKVAFLIYQESSLVIRAIRDYFQPDIGEILIDTDDVFEQAIQFMSHVMPNAVNRVKRYNDDVPLFSRFQIEHQIESAYSRQVNLPSGGAIVIDHTEALVSVDVNSGRATKGADIEDTAFKTNLEAAEEVARQLRLRDLGGLIVIDFIDMESQKNQREVEIQLRDALHFDRARVQMGKISRFGLLELSRQRLRPALAEGSYIPCPRCNGTGHIRSIESSALHILRIIEEEAMKDNTAAVHIQVPVDVATFLLNEKRQDVARIEHRHRTNLVFIPNRHMETPEHEIVRLRQDQVSGDEPTKFSYQMATQPAEPIYQPPSAETENKSTRVEAVVKGITPAQPAPIVPPKSSSDIDSLWKKILNFFTDLFNPPAPAPEAPPPKEERRNGERERRSNRGRRDNRENRDNRDNNAKDERGETRERTKNTGRTEQTARSTNTNAPATPAEAPSNPPNNRRTRNRKPQAEENRSSDEAPKFIENPPTEPPITFIEEGVQVDIPTKEGETTQERRGRRGRRNGRREQKTSDPVPTSDAMPTSTPVEDVLPAAAPTTPPVEYLLSPIPGEPPVKLASLSPSPLVQESAPPATKRAAPVKTQKTPKQATANVVEWLFSPEPGQAPVKLDAPTSPRPVSEPVAAPALPETPAPTPVSAQPDVIDTPAPIPAPTPAPQIEIKPSEPVVLENLLQDSGLTLVQTDPKRVQKFTKGEVPTPTRGRRPKAPVRLEEEPLVQVHTRS